MKPGHEILCQWEYLVLRHYVLSASVIDDLYEAGIVYVGNIKAFCDLCIPSWGCQYTIKWAPHFLINPFFPREITWPIVHGITPNLLHLILIDISIKCWEHIFYFRVQGCTNGPTVLFWGISVRIWWARHRSVTSGDIGRMWMSPTLLKC